MKQIVNQVVRGVFNLSDLLVDHRPFSLDLLFSKSRTEKDVEEQIQRQWQVLGKYSRIVAGVFFAGESIEHTTDRINLFSNAGGSASLGPFKEQMFKEVGNTILLEIL